MKENPLLQLKAMGQSIWLDYISRDLILSGKLKNLIEEDGLSGMTSNPSLFENAITSGDDYKSEIQALKIQNPSAEFIYEKLTIKDVQDAADQFYPLFEKKNGKEGFVSLEVNPHYAHDPQKTITEAKHLWKCLNRANVFIKVPGTQEGLNAIETLTAEGLNINVTLLFGLPRYREVAKAYISGIRTRIKQGFPVNHILSVASFFLSRIDTLVDPMIENKIASRVEMGDAARKIIGCIAIASARQAYQLYHEIFSDEAFKQLENSGANKQHLLWASTSTKNPKYSNVKYVEALIGPETINTLPLETLKAYRDHGHPEVLLNFDPELTAYQLNLLSEIGIDIDKVTQQLEDEGVEKFNQAYDQLINAIKKNI